MLGSPSDLATDKQPGWDADSVLPPPYVVRGYLVLKNVRRIDRVAGSWRVTAFRRFYIGESISNLGSTLTQFAIPVIAVITLKAPASAVGVIVALSSVPQFTVGLIAGAFVDKWRIKRTVLGYSALMAIVIAALPLIYLAGHLSLWVLFAFVIVQGSLATFAVSIMSFYPPLVAEEDLLDANMRLDVMDKASSVAGPGIAGWLIGFIGAPFTLVVDALSFVISLVFFAATPFRDEETPPAREPHSGARVRKASGLIRSILSGLRVLVDGALQRSITTQLVLQVLVSSMLAAIVPVYILRTLALSTATFGTLSGLAALAALLGAVFSSWFGRRFGIGAAAVIGSAIWSVGPILLFACTKGSSQPIVMALVFLSLAFRSVGSTVTLINAFTLRQRTVPRGLFGRVFSGHQAAIGLAAVCGGALAGVLMSVLGLRTLVLVVGVAAFIVPISGWFSPMRSATLDTK